MIKKIVFFPIIIAIFLNGCKDEALYNKTASFWYNKILEGIDLSTLDSADSNFLSLKSEHRKSPLVGEAMLLLAKAHLDFEEYEVAKYYYDSYIKMFGSRENVEFAKFMKLKANYYSFNRAYRDQKLLIDTIEESKKFFDEYPDSIYKYEVKMIVSRISLANIAMNKEIKKLYSKLDKPKGSEYYEMKIEASDLSKVEYKDAATPWYRYPFE